MTAYCVKCRGTRDIVEPKAIKFQNGRPATSGTCGVCGSKLIRVGKAE